MINKSVNDLQISSSDLQTLYASLNKKRFQLFLKRMLDIFFSSVFILIFLPLIPIISFIIKITSKGPVLFSQYRVGQNGHYFKCYKFRSMTNEHVKIYHVNSGKIKSINSELFYKHKNDNRVTKIGKILRRTSIDEFPQFFNVLKGEMSLIGPRPLIPSMLEPYPNFHQIRCLIKPGISGLWQIRERHHNNSAEYMFVHDTEYLTNFNIFLDLKILFFTPMIVISGKGAY